MEENGNLKTQVGKDTVQHVTAIVFYVLKTD